LEALYFLVLVVKKSLENPPRRRKGAKG